VAIASADRVDSGKHRGFRLARTIDTTDSSPMRHPCGFGTIVESFEEAPGELLK
jgi:hypothetical protein